MAQAGTTLDLGKAGATPSSKPLGFWPAALIVVVAVAMVMAVAVATGTIKTGSAGALQPSRAQIEAQRDADSLPVAVDRSYSQAEAQRGTALLPASKAAGSAPQHGAVLSIHRAKGYTDIDAQRDRRGQLP